MSLARTIEKRARRDSERQQAMEPAAVDVYPVAASPTIEPPHNAGYFIIRRVRLDDRGILDLHPASHWGFDIDVITASHDPQNWFPGYVRRTVKVGAHAWICSNVLLYNCIIGEGAIIAAGSVVRSCEVKPWTMVAGNPPQVVARCPERRLGAPWEYVDEKWTVLE